MATGRRGETPSATSSYLQQYLQQRRSQQQQHGLSDPKSNGHDEDNDYRQGSAPAAAASTPINVRAKRREESKNGGDGDPVARFGFVPTPRSPPRRPTQPSPPTHPYASQWHGDTDSMALLGEAEETIPRGDLGDRGRGSSGIPAFTVGSSRRQHQSFLRSDNNHGWRGETSCDAAGGSINSSSREHRGGVSYSSPHRKGRGTVEPRKGGKAQPQHSRLGAAADGRRDPGRESVISAQESSALFWEESESMDAKNTGATSNAYTDWGGRMGGGVGGGGSVAATRGGKSMLAIDLLHRGTGTNGGGRIVGGGAEGDSSSRPATRPRGLSGPPRGRRGFSASTAGRDVGYSSPSGGRAGHLVEMDRRSQRSASLGAGRPGGESFLRSVDRTTTTRREASLGRTTPRPRVVFDCGGGVRGGGGGGKIMNRQSGGVRPATATVGRGLQRRRANASTLELPLGQALRTVGGLAAGDGAKVSAVSTYAVKGKGGRGLCRLESRSENAVEWREAKTTKKRRRVRGCFTFFFTLSALQKFRAMRVVIDKQMLCFEVLSIRIVVCANVRHISVNTFRVVSFDTDGTRAIVYSMIER